MKTETSGQSPGFGDVYVDSYAELMTDPEFQARVQKDARSAFAEKGVNFPLNFKLDIHRNTKDTMHIVLPPPVSFAQTDNASLEDEALSAVSGGGPHCAGTAGSGSSASSAGCVPSTASTGGSASTASTAASASSS